MEKKTGDMYLAAAFLSYKAALEDIDRSDIYRQKFLFSGDVEEVYKLDNRVVVRLEKPSLDEVETLFLCGKLLFPPSYPEALRKIKSVLHTLEDD